jgi:hypothetical protein
LLLFRPFHEQFVHFSAGSLRHTVDYIASQRLQSREELLIANFQLILKLPNYQQFVTLSASIEPFFKWPLVNKKDMFITNN